jgi:phosphoglycolate phosphatase/pyrophosphatase PpaX
MMLKYPCLVLDHDDTVVQSEKTIGYPCFCQTLRRLRPDVTLTFEDYVMGCHNLGFVAMCREKWNFTDEELQEEYQDWMDYVRENEPDIFPGIDRIIRRQREEGGLICVVSHSSCKNISRAYDVHFGMQPDVIYGCDLPKDQQKPSPFPLEDIMRRFSLKPEELLVVDDMKLAWKMAHPLGVPTAFAAWSKLEFPEMMDEMRSLCDFTFDTTESLEKFLFE